MFGFLFTMWSSALHGLNIGSPPAPPTVFLAMDMGDFRNTYILGL